MMDGVVDVQSNPVCSPGLWNLIHFPYSQALKNCSLVSTSTGEVPQEGSVSTLKIKQDRENNRAGKWSQNGGRAQQWPDNWIRQERARRDAEITRLFNKIGPQTIVIENPE